MERKAVVTLGLCELFDVFGVPDLVRRTPAVNYKVFHGSEKDCHRLATWLPRERVPVVLYVDDIGRTTVSVMGRLYVARECVMLDRVLSRNTAVLAHFTEDVKDGRCESRVLVYDLALWNGEETGGMQPRERYSVLQGLLRKTKGLVSLQWAGDEDGAVRNREWMRQNIPHDIECLVTLGFDPWVLDRLMRVDVSRVGCAVFSDVF